MALDNKQLKEILTSAVKSLGYELWGYELSTGGRRLLIRAYIDAANGISIDDCAFASRQINAVLDVEMPNLQDYMLEVSSPGIDRQLFAIEQYERFIGQTIQVRTGQMYDNRRNFQGKLLAVADKEIVIDSDKKEYHLLFADIEKAKVVPEILIKRKS